MSIASEAEVQVAWFDRALLRGLAFPMLSAANQSIPAVSHASLQARASSSCATKFGTPRLAALTEGLAAWFRFWPSLVANIQLFRLPSTFRILFPTYLESVPPKQSDVLFGSRVVLGW